MRFRPRRKASSHPSVEAMLEQIESLTARNRERRDPELERQILDLRHRAGARLAGAAGNGASFPEPALDQLGDRTEGAFPEFGPGQLTPELVRAGILRDGAVLVRSLLEPEQALHLRDEIERAFEVRESGEESDGYYEPFDPGPDADIRVDRKWVSSGGLWPADSPKVMFQMLDAFDRVGLRRVIHGYLGERPAISIQKCTLRKVEPDSGAVGWHQDGAFLGEVRALNVWLSLSRCGDEAPGLDLVGKRLDEIVPTGTEGADFDWSASPQVVEEVAAPEGVIRPIFEPGDVLLFDEMNLHSTATDPAMPNPRYAIESWFFGLSGFPREYVPLAY